MKKINALVERYRALRARSGIRSRIMVYLILFVVFVIAVLWLFQVVLLERFYRAYKMSQVINTADAIVQNIDNDDLSSLAEQLASQNDVCIVVLDSDNKPIVSAEGLRNCLIHRMNDHELEKWVNNISESDKPVFRIFSTRFPTTFNYNSDRFIGPVPEPDDNQTMTLIYGRALTRSDGTSATLLINAHITPVTSTVNTIRFQLVVVTCILLVGAFILAFLISRNVSRPIIDTNKSAFGLRRGKYEPPKSHLSYREITQLNETLTDAARELNRVEELQHELIANISHDLRTPLTMIGGYAEVMRDIPSETTPENLQIIIDETSRLTSLVNELLDFSKLQTGTGSMDPEPFDLTQSTSEIITRIAKLTEKDGYIIRFEPQDSVTVLADPKRIAQVIYNLIGNALTYTGADKTVTITEECIGQVVRTSVRDTGKGIAPDELDLIWNRYYRTKETHKRAVVGSGLGLNIVRTILEKHNAKFGVDSKVGEGTTFWFELPIVEETKNTPKLPE